MIDSVAINIHLFDVHFSFK